MGGLGVVLVICAYLSILNASSFLIVRSLSVEWPAVVGGCCRDLSDVVATPFSDWYFCVVWLSSSITSCFAAVSSRPFFAVYWPLRACLLFWQVCYLLYDFGLDIWFCWTLSIFISLLLARMLRLLYLPLDLTAVLPFFRFGIVL